MTKTSKTMARRASTKSKIPKRTFRLFKTSYEKAGAPLGGYLGPDDRGGRLLLRHVLLKAASTFGTGIRSALRRAASPISTYPPEVR